MGLCTAHKDIITTLLETILINLINDATDTNNHDLEVTVRGSSLFDKNFTNPLSKEHPFYLLIHYLVPMDLTTILHNYIPKKKIRFRVFLDFMNSIMEKIDTNIWNRRSKLFKDWERSLNITKMKK